jgi:hypothetical protein
MMKSVKLLNSSLAVLTIWVIYRSVPDMVDDMALLKAFTPMKDGAKNAAGDS